MSRPLSTTSTHLRAVRAKAINKQVFRALLGLMSAALLVRLVGMLNQLVVSSHFGAGASMDAYVIVSTIPLLLAQLLGNVIGASVIPIYTRVHTKGTKDQASRLFSTLLNLFILFGVLITLIMFLFRSQLIFLTAPGSNSNVTGLAITLVPFIFPAFVLMVVLQYLEYIFNVEGQFGWPAYTAILVPLSTAFFVFTMGSSTGIVILCIGTVVGLSLQLCVFTLRARHAGFVYKPVLDLRNSEIGPIILAAWPVLIGAFMGQAINLSDQIFASFLPQGSISALSYSLKLMSVFSGVILASIGRAIFPHLSRHVAQNDMKSFKELLRLHFWILAIGASVLSIALIVLAHPIVRLLFQRGAFTALDTSRTANTLVGFLVGLTPMSFCFILYWVFSALGKTKVLMLVTFCSLLTNIIFDYIFSRIWGNLGIALSTSFSYSCSLFLYFFALRRIIGEMHLLKPPSEIVDMLRRVGGIVGLSQRGVYKGTTLVLRDKFLETQDEPLLHLFKIPYQMQRHMIRIGIIIAVFVAGVAGVILNSLYTLRAALGSVVIVTLLRYPYILLIAWAFMNALNAMPIFRGSNLLIGLAIPTLLLMTYMPIKDTFRRVPALGFFCVYLLWVFASIGISAIGVSTFLTQWILLLNSAAVGILTVNVLTTRRRMLGAIDAILLVSTFIALYGIYGYFTKQNGVPDSTNPALFRIASIFSPIAATLAIFLSLIIPLALYRMLTLHGFKRIGFSIVVIIFVVALGLTFTRSAYIGILMSIIIMVLFLPSQKMKISLLCSFLLLLLFAVILETVGHIPIFDRFLSGDITSLNGRTYLWQAVLTHFDPTHLLGNGLLASELLLTNLQVSIYGQGVIGDTSHNLFLGILYDHGIIGLILLIFVFTALVIRLFIGMRKASGDHQMLYVTVFAILVSMIVQSFQTNDILSQAFGVYFWIVMALPFALCWSPLKYPETDHLPEENLDEPTEPRMRAIQFAGKGEEKF